MTVTMKHFYRKSLASYIKDPMEKDKFYMDDTLPAQSIILTECVMYQMQVTQSLKDGGADLKAIAELYQQNIIQYTGTLRSKKLNLLKKILLCNLIVISVHLQNCTKSFLHSAVSHLDDFEWQKMLRFYDVAQNGNCQVLQMNTQIIYQNEYLGKVFFCNGRQQLTPGHDPLDQHLLPHDE